MGRLPRWRACRLFLSELSDRVGLLFKSVGELQKPGNLSLIDLLLGLLPPMLRARA